MGQSKSSALQSDENFLEGKLLIAMPGMGDPRFEKSVIFMCAHSAQGAMGLIINKPIDGFSFHDLMSKLGIDVTASPHDAPVLLLASIVAMAAGLAIVLGHNVWSGGMLPVVVTLVGWISLIKGLILLFLPPAGALAYFEAFRYAQFFYAYMSVTLIIGIYLTFSSFRFSR